MTNDDIAAATAAAFLKSFSKTVNQWSMVFALATLLILVLKHFQHFLIASVILALLQAYFAARCAFDAAIFQALAGEQKHYQTFDTVLMAWKFKKNNTERSLDQRIQGALRLLQQQTMSFIMQLLLFFSGIALV
mgnify:CR=1 FL=1